MSTHEQHHDYSPFEHYAIRALQELLAGREPNAEETVQLTGDVRACIDALQSALQADGVVAVRQAFTALAKDRPWLMKLVIQQPPSQTDNQAEQPPERRIRFRPDSAFEHRPARQWLIPAVLPQAGIAMVFGLPGCGKSFLTMAWSLCIASGTPWLGRPVLRGPVAYIAGEGAYGLGPRIRAWKTHNGYQGESGVKWFDETIMLQDSGNLNELVTALAEDFAQPRVLVVIDTLSRCSGGADENSNTEMARVIAAADVIQQRFRCTVLIVHHAGKDKDRGPRGASSLIGNTETILEVAPTDEGCRLICYKQKDAPKFDPIALHLQAVRYGPNAEESSAVLTLGSEQAPLKMTHSEAVMYAALMGKQLSYTDWIKAGVEAGLTERTAKDALGKVVKAGRVCKVGKCYAYPSNE